MPKLRNHDWREESVNLLYVRSNLLFEPDIKSYSAWLKKQAEIKGIQISTLWRYLGAAAFAIDLQTGGWATVKNPLQIPPGIHAESIELLEKIGRVMPNAAFDELAADLYHGRVVRKDLLKTWQIYRVALPQNATARGSNVQKPVMAENNERTQRIVFEQLALRLLRKARPEVLAYPYVALVNNTKIVALDSNQHCTAILIGRAYDYTILATDLVAVRLSLSRPLLKILCDKYGEQRLWLIAPAKEEAGFRGLPEKWGQISICDEVLTVKKPLPFPHEKLSTATQLLVSNLLERNKK